METAREGRASSVDELEDDGTLACLHLNPDEETDFFHCPTTNQHRLVNTSFWVIAFHDNVQTSWTRTEGKTASNKGDATGKGKMVVKIKPEKDSPEADALKFFTGSRDIQRILRKVKEMGKLPRKVTLRGGGNSYYLE